MIKVVGCLFYVLTLGLIGLVVNALLFMLVGWIADGLGLPFTVAGFLPAFLGAIVVSVVGALLHFIVPDTAGPPRLSTDAGFRPARSRGGSRRPRTSTRSARSW